ncbi:MAG: hypothetical protein FWG87_12200 [Defluviitaleaceae bacterium]|nr:hypothetical protein [Defluviitaleaceae bacterium]
MERGFPRIWRVLKAWNADFRGFGGFSRIFSDVLLNPSATIYARLSIWGGVNGGTDCRGRIYPSRGCHVR